PLCRCKKWTAPKEIITPASTGWQSELYSWSECVRITSEDLLVSLVDHSRQLYILCWLLGTSVLRKEWILRTDVPSSQHREQIGDRGLETRRFRYDYLYIL